MSHQQQTATTGPTPKLSPSVFPRCTHCGGRLFLSSDYQYKRLHYFWECSMCCREFSLNNVPVSRIAVGRVQREGWMKYPDRKVAVAVR
jgi:hypothetical protein